MARPQAHHLPAVQALPLPLAAPQAAAPPVAHRAVRPVATSAATVIGMAVFIRCVTTRTVAGDGKTAKVVLAWTLAPINPAMADPFVTDHLPVVRPAQAVLLPVARLPTVLQARAVLRPAAPRQAHPAVPAAVPRTVNIS